MKILALDIGDKHTGTALSDASLILASPYKTVSTDNLIMFLRELINEDNISTVVVGLPKTLSDKFSHQTNKTFALKEQLEKEFKELKWVVWDERLTSKSASQIKKSKNKQDKLHSHSLAAAIILNSYLDFLRTKKLNSNIDH